MYIRYFVKGYFTDRAYFIHTSYTQGVYLYCYQLSISMQDETRYNDLKSRVDGGQTLNPDEQKEYDRLKTAHDAGENKPAGGQQTPAR